jgi:uncharacterized protein
MNKLLISIHDVSPRHFDRVKEIDAFLQAIGVGDQYAMLVVPDFWGNAAIELHTEFKSWLAAKQADGVEMILHGYYHQDRSEHTSVSAKIKAKHLTASEGEFLGLSFEDAARLIQQGKQTLNSFLKKPVAGFIAPAWLYSDGARAALVSEGFEYAEDHWRVWSPTHQNARLLTGPVISYASRTRMRIASSLLWSRIASIILKPMKTVRIAIHPHDFDKSVLSTEIERALKVFQKTHIPVRYTDWIADLRAARV